MQLNARAAPNPPDSTLKILLEAASAHPNLCSANKRKKILLFITNVVVIIITTAGNNRNWLENISKQNLHFRRKSEYFRK